MKSWINWSTNFFAGRSSCSSLNNVPNPRSSLINTATNSINNKKEVTVQFRKVCINESQQNDEMTQNGDAKNGTTSPQSTLSVASSSQPHHRTSLIHISAEKRAKKVRFFINSDKFFKGAIIAVSGEKFRTFEKLLEHLTRIMCNQVCVYQYMQANPTILSPRLCTCLYLM